MSDRPAITTAEHQERRDRVMAALGESIGVVFAGSADPSLHGRWRADANFLYLTGLDGEPGAAVVFDPAAEDPRRRCMLFMRPLAPEAEAWDGYRDPVSHAMKERVGFATILRTTHLPRVLTDLARRRRRLSCLHPFAVYDAPVSPDLALFRKLSERVPGLATDDRTQVLPGLRAVKSPAELALMDRAVAATAAGYADVLATLRPGLGEQGVQRTLERAFERAGADGPAYTTIAGSGLNGTVLHYTDNRAPTAEGDLIVIDAGATFAGYAADITRTYPVSGRFTADQRRVYDVVLAAQAAAIEAVRPGVRMHEVDAAARGVIDRAGLGDSFIHGIGHQLGLEVHDAAPDGPLQPGMVVTIEPGVYLKDKALGVRIEDDVAVTASGRRVLSEAIAKDPGEIERLMRR